MSLTMHEPCFPLGAIGQSSSVMQTSGKDRSKHAPCPPLSSTHAIDVPAAPQSVSFRHGSQNPPFPMHVPAFGGHTPPVHVSSPRQLPSSLQTRAHRPSPPIIAHVR